MLQEMYIVGGVRLKPDLVITESELFFLLKTGSNRNIRLRNPGRTICQTRLGTGDRDIYI